MIILDFGSGNTCKNDKRIVKKMIDAIAPYIQMTDTVIKWQLFESAGNNVPLQAEVFDFAYNYAAGLGIQTTASVFDDMSCDFLNRYKIPFIKLACNNVYGNQRIHRKCPLIVSTQMGFVDNRMDCKVLLCVPKYPAEIKDYAGYNWMYDGISDHTVGLDLYRKYKPVIWEKHYKLKDSTGPDAGPFAITPEELEKVL